MQNLQMFSVDPLGGRRASPLAMLTRVPKSPQEVKLEGGGRSVPGTLIFASKSLTAQGNKKERGMERVNKGRGTG